MPPEHKPARIQWYRCKLTREQLSDLNRKSDFLAFLQTGGYLGLLAATATLSVYAAYHWPWYLTLALLFFHGTCFGFTINAFHELIHDSVFKTRWLNRFFLRVFSFIGWHNHHFFWASHTEHHKYTLHPPSDLEFERPTIITLRDFLSVAFINVRDTWPILRNTARHARGRVDGRWAEYLFPESQPDERRKLRNWARCLILGHGTIILVSLVMGWWMIPVVTSLAPFYGNGLHFLCNSAQHIGLRDNVADFRLCCRTIYLNPLVQFLYWHMNYHTEHHMYAGVPCYRLGKLHRLIKHEMPECPNGLVQTWRQIIAILQKQKTDRDYCYVPTLPENSLPTTAETAVPG
ncbi:MAG: fatty acid desaturase [Phycisphaerales bacterium]